MTDRRPGFGSRLLGRFLPEPEQPEQATEPKQAPEPKPRREHLFGTQYLVRVDPDEIIAARLGSHGIDRKVIRERPRDHRDGLARHAGHGDEVLFPHDE